MLSLRGCPHRSMVFEVSLCKEGFRQVEKESVVDIFKCVSPHEPGDEADQPLLDANGLKNAEPKSRQGTTETRGQRINLFDCTPSSDRRCGNVVSPTRCCPTADLSLFSLALIPGTLHGTSSHHT